MKLPKLLINIDKDLKERLANYAKTRDRTITYIVTTAIHQYLNKNEKRRKDK